jgi:predicted DNA binding protein
VNCGESARSVIGDHLLASVPETDVCLDGGHALAEVGVFGFQRVDAVVFAFDFGFEVVDSFLLVGDACCLGFEVGLRLVEDRGYACAWIGRDDESPVPVPQAVAGREAYLDTILTPNHDSFDSEPAQQALERDRTITVSPIETPERDGETPSDAWHRVATDYGFESALGMPIRHDGVRFGILAVYADDATKVDEREQAALAEYADTIGYALTTAERKRSLLSSRPITVQVKLDASTVPMVAVADALPDAARIEIRSTVVRDDGTTLYVVDVANISVQTLETCATEVDSIRSRDADPESSPIRCEMVVSGPTPEDRLAAHGVQVNQTAVEDGVATLSLHVPVTERVSRVRDVLEPEYETVQVSKIWRGQDGTSPTSERELVAGLTDRQREVLRHALDVGYFERPRVTNATELAEHFDIARATLAQHLRAGERNVLAPLFASDNP